MWADQIGYLFRANLQHLNELAGSGELILVGRLRQQLQSFLVGRLFLFGSAREAEMTEGILVIPQHTVKEGVSRIDAMPQNHVAELHCQDGGQAGLVRKYVDQDAAEHDGVADDE